MQSDTPPQALSYVNVVARPRLDGVETLRDVAALMIAMYRMVLLPDMWIPEYLDIIKTHFGKGVPIYYSLSGHMLAYGYIDKLDDHTQVINYKVLYSTLFPHRAIVLFYDPCLDVGLKGEIGGISSFVSRSNS